MRRGIGLAVLLAVSRTSIALAAPTANITSFDATQNSAGEKKFQIAGLWQECEAVEVEVPCVSNSWRPATLGTAAIGGTSFKRWTLAPLILCPGTGAPVDGSCLANRCKCYGSSDAQARCLVGGSPAGAIDDYPVDLLDCGPPVEAQCGDGFVDSGEQCDDGNLVSGDGCNSTCAREGGGGGGGAAKCGNGIVEGIEQCDDGNVVFGDGCTPTCLLESGDGGGGGTSDHGGDDCSGIFGCSNWHWPPWLCFLFALLVIAATTALVALLSSLQPPSGISGAGLVLTAFTLALGLYLAGCGCDHVWLIVGIGIVLGIALAIYVANGLNQLANPAFWVALVFAVLFIIIQTEIMMGLKGC
jgi:cysteine-rich repeat protein